MHIVIDARIISSSTGRYAESLLDNLEKLDTSHTYTVLVLRKDLSFWKPSKPNFKVVEADYPNYSFKEQLNYALLLYRLKPDLVHFCMPQQPLLYFGKRVTTVHDLTLVKYDNVDMNPFIYKIRKGIFIGLLRNVIWRSKMIVTPSNFVRKEIMNFTSKRYAPKIKTTHLAWDEAVAEPKTIPSLKNKRFIFFVGNAFPYKNLDTIVNAFSEVSETMKDLQLVFAGKKDYFYDQVEAHARKKGVLDKTHILGFIPEGEKRWLFRNGQAYIIASYSEGFHIPGLEAMAEECPVISSDATCLPEVYDTAAFYFDPDNSHELAQAITKVIENKKERSELIKRGNTRLKDFSWLKMAKETQDAYDKALRK
jgi:glycosyltransferase involved in cell wall biosynthesis